MSYEETTLDIPIDALKLSWQMYQEYLLLKEFQKKDDVLKSKYTAKISERDAINTKLEEEKVQLQNKEKELETIGSQKKAVLAEFEKAVDDKSQFRDSLVVTFNRKVGTVD